jgi:hypothetical protein
MRERKSSILIKLEPTYGVDSTPAGANAVPISNLEVSPLAQELVSRQLIRPFLGNSDELEGAAWKTVTFKTEVAGSGAAGTAPAWGKLLRACGMGETISAGVQTAYKPVSSAEESATIYCNYDGELHKLLGARGTWGINFQARQHPTFDFSFMGLFVPITNAGLPTVDLAAWIKPLPVNNSNTPAFTLHGFAAKLLDLSLTGNVENEYRNLVGMEQVDVSDRAPQGSLKIEPPAIASKDYFTLARSGATGVLSLSHGPAGNKVVLTLDQTQIRNPAYQTQGKYRYLQMGLLPLPSATGNDEITITAL